MINYPQIMNQHPSVVFHGGKAEMMMSTTGYSVGTQVTNYNFIIFHYYFNIMKPKGNSIKENIDVMCKSLGFKKIENPDII